MEIIKKIADFFSEEKRAAAELTLLEQKGEIKTLSELAQSPQEFLRVVNKYFENLGYRPFKPRHIKVFNVFIQGRGFVGSVFAIPRKYGFLAVSVGGRQISIIRQDDKTILEPTNYFRVYLSKTSFARCILHRGNSFTSAIFKEYQDVNGEFHTKIERFFVFPIPIQEFNK